MDGENEQLPLGGLVPDGGASDVDSLPEDPAPDATGAGAGESAPLADRLRPRSLDDVVGQPHLTGPEGALRAFLTAERIPSIVLWGPPGTGKTTLARLLGTHPGYAWE
ncbi:MAG: AAA family ATPase, partial [Candidatus Eisenbacteria bacterium]